MKFKKVLSGFLLLTVLSTSGIAVFANNSGELNRVGAEDQSQEILPISAPIDAGEVEEAMPISTPVDKENRAYYNHFTGKIIEINDYSPMEGAKIIFVENDFGSIANIIVSEDTYVVDGNALAIGSTITGYYKADAPMILIYPAQYNAEVVVIGNKGNTIKVDQFNEDLISRDHFLKLNISKDTKIISVDGTPFDGDLKNRNLVVTYDVSTRSIPAQTNPIQIVVLPEEESVVEDVIEDTIDLIDIDFSTVETVVNEKVIDGPQSYLNKDGVVMVPLRSIAEALGYDVKWNAEDQSIRLGNGISLKIGEDNYIYMKTPVINLGTAPELVENKTFVPLSFFREVVRLNNAYLLHGQIVINDGEKME